MSEPARSGRIDGDGQFRYLDYDNTETTWPTEADVARDWWADCLSRTGGKGEWRTHAHPLVNDLIGAGDPVAVEILQALVNAATTDAELMFVGAGPLEDLLSHSHHGAAFIDEVERRARQQPRFRKALAGVWLADDVPEQVRTRLGVLGARLL